MSDGTPTPPSNNEPAGAVTSREATPKKPHQGKFKSGFGNKNSMIRVDTNKHGIRRETNLGAKRTGRPKKV
jgi:hypothetical protein